MELFKKKERNAMRPWEAVHKATTFIGFFNGDREEYWNRCDQVVRDCAIMEPEAAYNKFYDWYVKANGGEPFHVKVFKRMEDAQKKRELELNKENDKV